MNAEIGTEAPIFLSGNICFKFSAFYLCSVRQSDSAVSRANTKCPTLRLRFPMVGSSGKGGLSLCAKNSGGMGTHNLQEMCKDK